MEYIPGGDLMGLLMKEDSFDGARTPLEGAVVGVDSTALAQRPEPRSTLRRRPSLSW
jgi:hypothetical protein